MLCYSWLASGQIGLLKLFGPLQPAVSSNWNSSLYFAHSPMEVKGDRQLMRPMSCENRRRAYRANRVHTAYKTNFGENAQSYWTLIIFGHMFMMQNVSSNNLIQCYTTVTRRNRLEITIDWISDHEQSHRCEQKEEKEERVRLNENSETRLIAKCAEALIFMAIVYLLPL